MFTLCMYVMMLPILVKLNSFVFNVSLKFISSIENHSLIHFVGNKEIGNHPHCLEVPEKQDGESENVEMFKEISSTDIVLVVTRL